MYQLDKICHRKRGKQRTIEILLLKTENYLNNIFGYRHNKAKNKKYTSL